MMDATEETEGQTRRLQHDIERTRHEMDRTLTQLETRLAPSEILHRSASSLRQRLWDGADGIVEAIKQHPSTLAIAAGLLATGFAMRPSADERLARRAADDLERAQRVVATGVTRAKDHAIERASVRRAQLDALILDLATAAGRLAHPAVATAGRLGRLGTEQVRTNPTATLALIGVAAAFALTRRRRAHRRPAFSAAFARGVDEPRPADGNDVAAEPNRTRGSDS